MIPEIEQIWNDTVGEPEIRVAVLDGPVDVTHPSLRQARLRCIPSLVPNSVSTGAASRHGTQVASILFGQHSTGRLKGVAPRCTGFLLPVFSESLNGSEVFCSQLDLARAIIQATDLQVHLINISGGQFSPSGAPHPILRDAITYAVSKGVLIVAAAGNDGCECLHIPGSSPQVLAVGAMGRNMQPLDLSNWGLAYLQNGVLAPGEDIPVALPGGQYGVMTGTSSATAIVTGVCALLLSLQYTRGYSVRPDDIRKAIVSTATIDKSCIGAMRQRMMAGRLNIAKAIYSLGQGDAAMSTGNEQDTSELRQPKESLGIDQTVMVHPSDCACGCKTGSTTDTSSSPPTSLPPVQLIYALGTLGIDFGTEARRDSITHQTVAMENQRAGGYSPKDLLNYLDKNPWDAQSILWTLNLESTPVYVIQPMGAFAAVGYERLRQFLREQIVNGVERVSIPGVIMGRARVITGQVLPVIWPDLRGMNNWNTSALVGAVSNRKASSKVTARNVGLAGFLDRIYYEFRNLGLTPQDRALNFAASNALSAAKVFEAALKDEMQLDSVEVERSAICRPESDCWDVKLIFFDPENQTRRARIAYRFTVDVSDINPVMVGDTRSWPIH